MEIATFVLILAGGLLFWSGLNYLLSGWPWAKATTGVDQHREAPGDVSARRSHYVLESDSYLHDEPRDRASIHRNLLWLAAGLLAMAAGAGLLWLQLGERS